MRSVTDFTICLWMNSADSQGTPLSYAVSSEANELLIFYNGQFQLYIGGTQRLYIQYELHEEKSIMLTVPILA